MDTLPPGSGTPTSGTQTSRDQPDGTSLAQARQQAETLASQGDLQGAIAVATAALRDQQQADPALLAALVRWRRDGFAALHRQPGPAVWPPSLPDPFPGHTGIPTIAASDLTAEILGGAIQHHGCLRVNGLVSPAEAARLQQGIDRGIEARDDAHAGRTPTAPGWYVPLEMNDMDDKRHWVETGGAVWTADSPPMLYDVIDMFTRSGVIGHIAGYMGEQPLLSVAKSTLRRVPVTSKTDWHQDGSFLGREVRAVNVWLALSPCGRDAPGLDVVGSRLPYVVQTGTHGAYFDWSVGEGMVDLLAEGGAPIEVPEFAAGDALLFDHLMLHRTGVRPTMTRERWAIESWFFAPTDYPMEQIPLVVS